MTEIGKSVLLYILITLFLLGGTVTELSVPKYIGAGAALGFMYLFIVGYERTLRSKIFSITMIVAISLIVADVVQMSEELAKIALIALCYGPVREIQKRL